MVLRTRPSDLHAVGRVRVTGVASNCCVDLTQVIRVRRGGGRPRQSQEKEMKRLLKLLAGAVGVTLASAVMIAAPAQAQSDQQKLVNNSMTTLSNFLRDPDMTWLQQNIGRAKAVMI